MLTGALVVRLSRPPYGNGAEHVEERASTEGLDGGHTEAFRLPGKRDVENVDALFARNNVVSAEVSTLP